MNMKPFNIELAKAGHPVCTRDGHKVRIVCFDKKDADYPIIVLIDYDNCEAHYTYTLDGKYMKTEESEKDLFMVCTKKEGWINIYEGNQTGVRIFDSKENAFKYRNAGHIDTIKIEWEE